MKELYTYIMEFQEGTYITQVHARDLEKSLYEWTNKLREESIEIYNLDSATLSEITEQIIASDTQEIPTPVKGLQNVWCLTLNTKQGFGIVNIVKTKSET